jgi:hypothetical protein
MPQDVKTRYKEDAEFRERMKANSRKRYAEMKEALQSVKKSRNPPPLPLSSVVDQSIPSSS